MDKTKKEKKALKRIKAKEKELDKFLETFVGAATVQEAERVHSLINDAITTKLGSSLLRAKALIAKGRIEDAGFEIDKDDITVGIRWCVHNKTEPRKEAGAIVAEQTDELARIRERNRTKNLKAIG